MTLISDLLPHLRVVLGDDPDSPQLPNFSDPALTRAVQSMVTFGKLTGYVLNNDKTQIEPTITDPNKLALLVYHTAVALIQPRPDSYEYQTRAVSEKWRGSRAVLQYFQEQLRELESGSLFNSVDDYCLWLCLCGCVPQGRLPDLRAGIRWFWDYRGASA